MATRNSGYARQPRDLYETPAWVTDALVPFIPPWIKTVWEPACASGKIVNAIKAHNYDVIGTDIYDQDGGEGYDFLLPRNVLQCDAIITNPPFGDLAQQFVETALTKAAWVAMLLPMQYDCAKGRRHLFRDCPAFAQKITLTRRIVWFERPGAAPSENHSWYIWDNLRTDPSRPATIGYAP